MLLIVRVVLLYTAASSLAEGIRVSFYEEPSNFLDSRESREPDKGARVLLSQSVDKRTHWTRIGRGMARWQSKRLIIWEAPPDYAGVSQLILSYQKEGDGSDEGDKFDLCNDDVKVDVASDWDPGGFRLRVNQAQRGRGRSEYIFRAKIFPPTHENNVKRGATYETTSLNLMAEKLVQTIQGTIDRCGLGEVLKSAAVQKYRRRGIRTAWDKRWLVVRERSTPPFATLELYKRDEDAGEFPRRFAICEDNVQAFEANDHGSGSFRIKSEGRDAGELIFRVLGSQPSVERDDWISQIVGLREQCKAHGKPPPRWAMPAGDELRFIQCHAENLVRLVSYNYALTKFARWHGSGEWDGSEIHKRAVEVKRGLRKTVHAFGPIALTLQNLTDYKHKFAPKPYEEDNCGDIADFKDTSSEQRNKTAEWLAEKAHLETQLRQAEALLEDERARVHIETASLEKDLAEARNTLQLLDMSNVDLNRELQAKDEELKRLKRDLEKTHKELHAVKVPGLQNATTVLPKGSAQSECPPCPSVGRTEEPPPPKPKPKAPPPPPKRKGPPPKAPPPKAKTKKDATNEDVLTQQIDSTLSALERLLDKSSANVSAVAETGKSAVVNILDLDRDYYIRASKSRSEAPTEAKEAVGQALKNAGTKLEYQIPFSDPKRTFMWAIQIKGINDALAKLNTTTYEGLISSLFIGDRVLTGSLEDPTAPDLLQRLERFQAALEPDELESFASDGMLALYNTQPQEFYKMYSGVADISRLIMAITHVRDKKPGDILKCTLNRFSFRDELKWVQDLLPEKEAYYNDGMVSDLVAAIEVAASAEMMVFLREMKSKGFKDKPVNVQKEYMYIERTLREKATIPDKDWIQQAIRKAAMPQLYLMNVLKAGDDFRIASRHKEIDNGRWSPNYMDVFLRFAEHSIHPDSNETFLAFFDRACGRLARYGAIRVMSEGIGAQIVTAQAVDKEIQRCSLLASGPDIASDWNSLLSLSKSVLGRLEEVETKCLATGGALAARLTRSEKDSADWHVIRNKVRDFVKKEMSEQADDGKAARVHGPEAVFDDFTMRNSLHAFCKDLRMRQGSIGSFYSLGSPHLGTPDYI